MYLRIDKDNCVWACLENPADFKDREQPYEFCIGAEKTRLQSLANARQELLAAVAEVNILIIQEVK